MSRLIIISLLLILLASSVKASNCVVNCQNSEQQNTSASSINFLPSLQFQHFSTEHGLSNISIGEQAILRDKQGFLWVSTQDGLNRYDGYQFKHYFHDPENSNSVSNSIISALYESQDGLIWIGTWGGGINSFNPATEEFTHYKSNNESDLSLLNDYVSAITQDKNENIWVATQNGLIVKRSQENTFFPYSQTSEKKVHLASNDIRVLHYTHNHNLWVGTRDKGVIRIELSTNKHYVYNQDSAITSKLKNNDVQDIFEDKEGNIWISTGAGLNKYQTASQRMLNPMAELKSHPLNNSLVRKIVDDAEGNLWITTLSGLYHLELESNEIKYYVHDPSDRTSISSHDVNTIYRDHEGNIWLGFQETGLDRFHPSQELFNFHKSYDQDFRLSNNLPVSALLLDNNQDIWLGTPVNGLYRKRTDGHSKAVAQYNSQSDSLSDDQISTILQDSQNRIWVGTLGGGLNLYEDKTDSFRTFSFDSDDRKSLSNNYVYSLAEDRDGVLWVGTSQGLNRLESDNQSFSHFFSKQSQYNINNVQSIRAIEPDKKGNLWLGTQNGLFYFNTRTYEYNQFINHKEEAQSISNNWIVSLYTDNQGLLWIGTAGGGVNLYDPVIKNFQRLGLNEGLPSGIVYDIFQDSEGIMWLSTANGLVSYDYSNKQLSRYTTKHGLQDNNFNKGAFQSDNGELFFGGPKGFNRFFPNKVKAYQHKQNSQVVLTDFLLFNQSVAVNTNRPLVNKTPVLTQSIFATDTINLNHKHNLFGFEFANLNFNTPSHNFAYRLKGWDENWVLTESNRRYATYTNIPPGQYEFQVKAVSSFADENPPPTSVGIVIKAAPWRTGWAYAAYIFIGLIFIYILLWLILRKKAAEKKIRMANEIADTKEQLLATVSHEFRTPLTLILGPVRTLMQDASHVSSLQTLRQIENNGKRLLSMVDQLLDMAKIKWQQDNNSKAVSVIPACRSLVDSFQSVANENDIKLSFFTDISLDYWVYISKESLETLLVNLLSNAIKYTPEKGKVEVIVSSSPDWVEIKVLDTGYGIAPQDQQRIFERFTRIATTQQIANGAGIGLSLVKAIVEQANGDISVLSQLNQGSVFIVKLPLVKKSQTANGENQFIPSISVVNSIEQLKSLLGRSETDNNINVSNKLEQSRILADTNNSSTDIKYTDEKPFLLVVEDNYEMRRYICNSLNRSYRILEASNGEQGVRLAKQECPDLIISDVMMPHTNGFQMIKMIRNELVTSHIPVILLSAKGDQESRLHGLSALADDYITKPFDAKELNIRIQNLLSIRELLKERFRDIVSGKIEDKSINDFTNKELAFYRQFEKCIKKRASQAGLTLSMVASELAMSDRQFQRKINALGIGFSEFLKSHRLEQAVTLLKNQEKVTVIAEQVGFSSNTYFARCFKAKYGLSPSQYRDKNKLSTS